MDSGIRWGGRNRVRKTEWRRKKKRQVRRWGEEYLEEREM